MYLLHPRYTWCGGDGKGEKCGVCVCRGGGDSFTWKCCVTTLVTMPFYWHEFIIKKKKKKEQFKKKENNQYVYDINFSLVIFVFYTNSFFYLGQFFFSFR